MLRATVHQSRSSPAQNLLPCQKPFLSGTSNCRPTIPIRPSPELRRSQKNVRVSYAPGTIKAVATPVEKASKVKVVVTLKNNPGFVISDLLPFTLELFSSELDPKTGQEKKPIKVHVHRELNPDITELKYEGDVTVSAGFGEIGAVSFQNKHINEVYLETIELNGFASGAVNFTCNSYVQRESFDGDQKRIFFSNKSYLPSKTPSGLTRLREEELRSLRGDGQGRRECTDRIYDYDVYNDLGSPDSSPDEARPVLGGHEHPYPRRCRTGRPPSGADPSSESRNDFFYVPRDEAFSEVKSAQFSVKTLYSALHAVVPSLETIFVDKELGFPYFTAIDQLFNEGINVPALKEHDHLGGLLPRIVKSAIGTKDQILRFETPELIDRDKFAWFRDEEFSRQTLAGLNPLCIRLVTEWPLKSKLDPNIYGPPESAITKEIIDHEIGGMMTVEEAVAQKKLFILDYHDLLLPYVNRVREIDPKKMITTLYGSRTVFFLTPEGTLRPLAIELTRPPSADKPQWKQVFTPTWDATGSWLWKLAKAQVLAHDSGYHQLVSHWLRTHCAVEPYVIATNRQLSAMHPIYRLLRPHLRYTMEINALARSQLINADGIIESSFSPGKYSIELSSAAYDKEWRFDRQALPADLISRGMAVEDPTAPHGLKLRIEDYPFANDGLLLWDAIKQWVTSYVNRYYPETSLVQSDQELQAWWTEIVTVGHADKTEGWPELKTPHDLSDILTNMIWVTSGHHAAVNFGQYDFAGYFPNRPTIARTNMPTEDPSEETWNTFLKKPEDSLLKCFPAQVQAAKVITTLDVLSSHSPDEEYIGDKTEPCWEEDPVIKAAFEEFNGQLKKLEGIIDARNADTNLKNRTGAGVVPYQLLKPFSGFGVTGKGVPNSISI